MHTSVIGDGDCRMCTMLILFFFLDVNQNPQSSIFVSFAARNSPFFVSGGTLLQRMIVWKLNRIYCFCNSTQQLSLRLTKIKEKGRNSLTKLWLSCLSCAAWRASWSGNKHKR